MTAALKGLVLPVAMTLAWEFASRSGFIVADSMSYPSAIARAGLGAMVDGSLFQATRYRTVSATAPRSLRAL